MKGIALVFIILFNSYFNSIASPTPNRKLLMGDGEATEMEAEFGKHQMIKQKTQHYVHQFDQQNEHGLSNRRGQRSVDDCPDCFDPDFVYNDDSISSSAQNSKNSSQNLIIFCPIIVIIVIGIFRNGIFI